MAGTLRLFLLLTVLSRALAQSHVEQLSGYGDVVESDQRAPAGIVQQAKSWFNGQRSKYEQQNTGDRELPGVITTVAPTNPCQWEAPEACKFPFYYQGNYYSQCTAAGGFAQSWCSLDYTFHGHWQSCQKVCSKAEQDMGKIIGGVVGGTAAAIGLGVGVAMIVKSKNEQTTTAPFVAAAAPPVQAAAAAVPPAGVQVVSYAIPAAPAPAAARLYGADQKVTPSAAGVASYLSGPTLAFLALLALFTLMAVVGTLRRSQKRAKQSTMKGADCQDMEVSTTQQTDVDEVPLLNHPDIEA